MEKINASMSTMEMMLAMSEGNPGAATVMVQMVQDIENDPEMFWNILICDHYDIRGPKLYMLNNDSCRRNFEKFRRTLTMIRSGVFSEEEIHKNLSLIRSIPFIDDEIVIEGVPPYGEKFGPSHEKWDEFCKKNKEAFVKRLAEEVEAHEKLGFNF